MKRSGMNVASNSKKNSIWLLYLPQIPLPRWTKATNSSRLTRLETLQLYKKSCIYYVFRAISLICSYIASISFSHTSIECEAKIFPHFSKPFQPIDFRYENDSWLVAVAVNRSWIFCDLSEASIYFFSTSPRIDFLFRWKYMGIM